MGICIYKKQRGQLEMQKNIEDSLLKIAKEYSTEIEERGDLETRMDDSEDFLEISVWGLKKMLEEAYKLGLKEQR